jgi:glycosyltransferase involved in cell wall biosynthesis
VVPSGLISVLIPLYNEEAYIAEILSRVMAAALPTGCALEIVIVDDGSTDRSADIAEQIRARHPEFIRLIRNGKNRGKGAAVRAAIEAARGEFCVIQDADLEYHPREYLKLMTPLIEGSADVVYGSRFMNSRRPALYFWHSVANYLLTGLCNVFSGLELTDALTGYKAFRTSLVKTVPLGCDGFAIEAELTMKLAKRGARFVEVAIGYEGRSYRDGKKVGLKDAFETAAVIFYCGAANPGRSRVSRGFGPAKSTPQAESLPHLKGR